MTEFTTIVDNKQKRLRFINNIFTDIVTVPSHIPMKEWERTERERVREVYGPNATLSHYTRNILTPRSDDSDALRERRKTIHEWVYDAMDVPRPIC